MEFYVVDPKDLDFTTWVTKVREFLAESAQPSVETEGGLYYLGDDIATPWEERSHLFDVEGDEGGVIEVRDVDRNLYVFADDFDLFDEREVKEALGHAARSSGALYGFRWNSAQSCRFHVGPSTDLFFFCPDDENDYPPPMEMPELWRLFFKVTNWVSNNTSRIQDLRNMPADKVSLDFVVEFEFAHPASLDGLTEVLVEEEGYERTRTGLRATFRDRDAGWIHRFVSLLPTDPGDFEEVLLRAVWRGEHQGRSFELFYVGIERRNLRPFVQMPVHRTSKALLDKFRNFFKGHRIDRQEYFV